MSRCVSCVEDRLRKLLKAERDKNKELQRQLGQLQQEVIDLKMGGKDG